MRRKTKSVIACGMAAALMLTTLGMVSFFIHFIHRIE